MTNEEAHALSRKRGTSMGLRHRAVRAHPDRRRLVPLQGHRPRVRPAEGPAIIAPNHKSFYDSFFVGLATTRHLHFMAKTELFEGKSARLLSGLGAFPVRRGDRRPRRAGDRAPAPGGGPRAGDVPRGDPPPRPGALRAPRRGVGRLAIEAGAPIVPCAITGTDKLFAGLVPEADEGPGVLRPRDLAGRARSHARGRRRT